jgi:ParB family chromosome partitioning protein
MNGNQQDDEPVLGRGLESLIPPQRQPQSGGPAPQYHGQPIGAPENHVHQGTTPVEPAVPLMPDGDVHGPAPLPVVQPAPVEPLRPPAEPVVQRAASEDLSPAGKYPDAIFHIEADRIVPNPDQPRRNFDEEGIRELAASIREFGLLQPLVVTKIERETPTGMEVVYQLISGERRLLASRMLGLPRVPAIVRSVASRQENLELAVIENIQRENLNPVELARAYARLQDEFRLTQREIASRLGKSRETVANTLRLLDLPADIQKAVEEGKITESHGRLLLTIDNPGLQQKLFKDLLENRMTTRELYHKAKAGKPKQGELIGRGGDRATPEVRFLQERLSSELGAPVSIHQSGEGGRITINFYSEEELQNILNRLGGGATDV